jgi:hypothetical protein
MYWKQLTEPIIDDVDFGADKLFSGEWAIVVKDNCLGDRVNSLCFKEHKSDALAFPFTGGWSSAPSKYLVRRLPNKFVIHYQLELK